MKNYYQYTGPGGKYRYRFEYAGNIKTKVVKTHAEGKEWLAEEKARAKKEEQIRNLPAALMFSQASREYLEACQTWQGANTVQEKFRAYKDLVEFVGTDFAIESFDLSHANRFKVHSHKKFGPKATNRRFQKLSALWSHLVKEGRLHDNPWRKVERLPEEDTLRKVPTSADVSAILLAAKPWERDFLLLLLQTAARPGEIRNLLWDDVNFERGHIILWTRKRQGGRKEPRALPMTKTSREVLSRQWKARQSGEDYVFTNPATGQAWERNHRPIKHLMKRLCQRAGLPVEYTLYGLRHYTAQRLADSGKASLVDNQRLLGHQRPTTTDAYLRSLAPDLSRLADLIESEATPHLHTARLESNLHTAPAHDKNPDQSLRETVGA